MPAGFTSLAEFTIAPNNHLWKYYTLTTTYTGPSNVSALFIQSAPWDDADTIVYLHDSTKNIGIDDISIVPTASACAFTFPGPISSHWPSFNLFHFAHVCVTGGTFSWPTMPILPGGSPTTSTSSTFDPANAYAAAVAAGDTSEVPVAYTYTTSAGCVQTVYAILQMTDTTLAIDTIVTDTTVTDTTTITGFNSLAGQSVHIYPNPANEILYIDFVASPQPATSPSNGGAVAYRLLRIEGLAIQQGGLNTGHNSIPIQSMSPGIYLLELTGGNGQKTLTKIIKQ
jgi:hypothetical protein